MKQFSRIVTKILRHQSEGEKDKEGYVIMKSILLHTYANVMRPEMNIEELTRLVLSSERYKTKEAQGQIRVNTISKEAEAKGKTNGGRKRRLGERAET